VSQFAPEDSQGSIDLVSNGDITFEADRDQDGAGDLVFRTGGVERARIKHDGSGTGWPNVLGGSISAVGGVTIQADNAAAGTGDIVFQTDGTIEAVKIPNAATAKYGGAGLLAGNDHNTDYGPNTGTPAGNVIPIRFQHLFGTPGTAVPQTTQLMTAWAKYKERTKDDSAEALNFGVILTDAYGGFGSPQTLPVVALEGDALVQGAVTVSNKVVALTGGVQIQNTAHADSVMHFYAAQTNVVGTVTSRYGFYDEGVTGAGTITNNWSFYGKFRIQTEDRLYVGVAGVPATQTQRVLFVGSSADTTGTLAVQMGTGQSTASIQVRDSGGVQRGQWFGSTGNLFIGNAATGGSGGAIISMVTTTAPTGTPPTAGVYLYVDPADSKLKAKTSGGTVTVLTPTI
jgi:hypothetical protein